MSPDPFRPLDRIDPPEQWDEIARRAGSDALDVDLELDAVPDHRPRRRAVTVLAAAAAVVAVLAGTVVATSGNGEDDGVATDPTVAAPAVDGPCPFTLDPELVVPPLVPGSGEPPFGILPDGVTTDDLIVSQDGSWGTVDYGGIPVTVVVYADGAEPIGRTGETQAELRPDGETVDVVAWAPVEGSESCRTAAVRARLPLTDEDRALREEQGDDAVNTSRYLSDPVPSRILRAVRLSAQAEDVDTTSTLPADQLGLDGDCPFRLDPAAGIGPLTPIDRPEDANAQRSDRPATWGSVTVGDDEVLVGVGEADPQRTPNGVGERSAYEGGGGQDPAVDTLEGSGWLTDGGPCSFVSARAYLPAAPRPEETSSTVPERILRPSSEEILVSQRLQWLVDRVLDAVVAPGSDGSPLTLDCGGRSDPDAGPTAEGRRCPLSPDPATLPPVTFPDDFGEPPPPEPPTPAARPDKVYFEAEAWDGFPIYVTRGQRGVCIMAKAGSEGCSSAPGPGLSPAEVPDPETGEPGGVALLGSIPDAAVSTEIRSPEGSLPGAEVTIAPDGEWFVAWVPIPLAEMGLEPWPIVHRDADGNEIPSDQQ